MNSVERAKATQLANIQKKTGKSLVELIHFVESSGLKKHGEIRSLLIEKLGLTYGDAHNLALYVLKAGAPQAVKEVGASGTDILDEMYSGLKANLRPIHEKLMNAIQQFGDFEIAPKKGYVSLRRKRQFAMLGPATNTKIELGLNVKHLAEDSRLVLQPAGSMCNYKIRISDLDEIDESVVGWLREAFNAAG
jgi:Domain of unknown function (DUF5655)/Domain of unknown function (DUF4287)